MGNSSSKPDSRHSSTSSTAPLTAIPSIPVTPTGLLSSTAANTNTAASEIASSSASVASPIASPTSTFTFPGRRRQTSFADEVDVKTFSGNAAPASRPVSSYHHTSPEQHQQDGPQEISEISQPKPMRPKINRLSELIDPISLANNNEKVVRSPSGQMLGRRSFEEREDRPLSMRERQELIRQRVMAQTAQLAAEAEAEKKGGRTGQGKKSRGCCSCFSG